MVDTMSPQYVFYWIAVGNKKLPIQKVVCKIEKVEWKKLYTKYKTLYTRSNHRLKVRPMYIASHSITI
jgi:hypothetical protein